MQETKYGVELDIKIDKFKSKMKEASNTTDKWAKKMQQSLSLGGIYKDADLIRRNLNWTKDTGIKELNVNWDAFDNKVKLTKTDLSQTTSEMKDMEKQGKNTSEKSEKNFGNLLKSVKRLTIGFLGARSAFMLFRKYLGEYSSQNEEFANKMQLTTNVLVNTLAPAFEFFANVIQYAVIGLARIIELLTGVNILSKTVDNGFKGASKSAKEFTENLSGLDEISNISEEQGGLGTSLTSQLNAMEEFQKKIKEVDEWLQRSGIKKFLEDLRPILKDIFEWMFEHPLGALGLYGGLKLLGSMLPGIMLGTAGKGTGLLDLYSTLGGLAITGVVTVGVKLVGDLGQESLKSTEEAVEQIEDWKVEYDEMLENWNKKSKEEPTQKNLDAIVDILNAKKRTIEAEIRTIETTLTWYDWLNNPAQYYKNKDKISNLRDDLTELDAQILEAEIKSGRKTDLFNGKFINLNDNMKNLKKTTKEVTGSMSELSNSFNGLNNVNVNPQVNVIGNAQTELNDIWYKLQKIGGTTIHIDAYGNYFGGSGRSLAMGGLFTGSNWLPITAYAGGGLADEGQMFVAREAGPELVGTIGGHTAVMNNDQIVASVSAGVYDAVVSAMSGQSDRPIVLNIDGREFAKVTYSDYQAESSRRGTNTALRRY